MKMDSFGQPIAEEMSDDRMIEILRELKSKYLKNRESFKYFFALGKAIKKLNNKDLQ